MFWTAFDVTLGVGAGLLTLAFCVLVAFAVIGWFRDRTLNP